MTELKELKEKYYNDVFTFKSIRRNIATYEKKYKNKTVIVKGDKDYRSDLDLKEPLSSLDSELEIFEITE